MNIEGGPIFHPLRIDYELLSLWSLQVLFIVLSSFEIILRIVMNEFKRFFRVGALVR